MGKSKFSLIAIRILSECETTYRKVLEENVPYIFNQDYSFENEWPVKLNGSNVPENFFSDKINIHAIVGKNGSGKSSIVEIIIRIINNLIVNLSIINKYSDPSLHYAPGLNAELYYEYGKDIFCIRSSKNKVYLIKNNEFQPAGKYLDIDDDVDIKSIGEILSIPESIDILKQLFFSLVNNYSFHSYNAHDFWDECVDKESIWINGLFHKNDGYLTPIVLNPFRDFGKVDMEREKRLANLRLATLFYSFAQENKDFIPDYKYAWLSFAENKKHVEDKFKYYPIRKGIKSSKPKYYVLNLKNKDSIFSYTLRCYLGQDYLIDEKYSLAYKYLVYKTFSISNKYPSYKNNAKISVADINGYCHKSRYESIKKLVNKIKDDHSHITLKVKQTLKFIDFLIKNENNNHKTLDDNYLKDENNYIVKAKLSDLDIVNANFPPPFYSVTIHLKSTSDKFVTFDKMSSGERQFLFYMSSILYHLKNINSVKETKFSVPYKYINVILEEVELYFHPDYQRLFIQKLIQYIEQCNFENIDYFNFLIITHSPFILSDLPNSKIMFLKKGEQIYEDNMATFGANIHDMLKHSFFLDDGLIGEFSKSQIKRVLCYLNNDCQDEYCSPETILQIINLIGEPLIKDRLLSLYKEKFPTKNEIDKDEQIRRLTNELRALKIRNLKQNIQDAKDID